MRVTEDLGGPVLEAGPATAVSVGGILVGHFTDREGLTGCTVLLVPSGSTASVDIRGGAPGTLETDLLSPYAVVNEIHGILLTGGSAPGLGAAAGVTRFLKEKGSGYRTPYARVPLVAAAVIYDLGVGSPEACPSSDHAYEAASSAGERFEEGSVGAGTGATVGKLLGAAGLMKGGIAFSSVKLGGGVTVGALTVVNALGDVVAEDGSILAGARRAGVFADSRELLLAMSEAPTFAAMESTTLSVVMTDGRLDKVQCGIVARMSHDGMARAVNPVHTPVDGDCVFVVATGDAPCNVFQVGAAAAEAVAMGIRRAVRVAEGLGGVTSWQDLARREGGSGGPPALESVPPRP